MAATDAKAIPKKNTALRITLPIFDADGDLVSGATGLDSEISKDGGAFADCASEATEIGSSGMYFLDLTSTEMNADTVVIVVKTTSAGAKTTPIVLYTAARSINDLAFPVITGRGMVVGLFGAVNADLIYADALNTAGLTTHTGTAQAGGASTITLAATASTVDNYYVGQEAVLVTPSTGPVTGSGQARLIIGYVGATRVATVDRAWATNPDGTSVYVTKPSSARMSAIGADVLTAAAAAADFGTELAAAVWASTLTEPTGEPTFSSTVAQHLAYWALIALAEIDATTSSVAIRNMADSANVATHATSDVAGVFVHGPAS